MGLKKTMNYTFIFQEGKSKGRAKANWLPVAQTEHVL